MKIAVDAMGGDKAPHEIVKGAVIAAQRFPDDEVLLVGDEKRIQQELGVLEKFPGMSPFTMRPRLLVWTTPQPIPSGRNPILPLREASSLLQMEKRLPLLVRGILALP